jgi:hypothetical protein
MVNAMTLDQIDRQVEPGLGIHVLCDNLSAHRPPGAEVQGKSPLCGAREVGGE